MGNKVDVIADALAYDRKAVKKEMVNHPLHYGGDTPYECIKVLKAWMSPEAYRGFCKGNTIKYLCRLGKKDEDLQELEKAKFYLDCLIESYEENKKDKKVKGKSK